jgi:hypothetical protein
MDCWVAQLGVETEQHRLVAEAITLRTQRGRVQLATDTTLRDREISPFVVNVENNGKLSNHGLFRTQPDDLKALVTIQIDEARKRWNKPPGQPLDVAFYAHGGLVSEADAADTAARWIPALYEAQIFPIFLMWETDLWSTIKNRLSDLVSSWMGVPSRPTAGLRDQVERLWNRRVERTLSEPGSVLWDEMKQNAHAISVSQTSGAYLLHSIGAEAGTLVPGKVRLHLIGHSAGAIVHSHVVDSLAANGWSFSSVTFMAPAVRSDVFDKTVGPHLGGRVERYYQFHLSDDVEKKDPTCRPLLMYGRSLLYLVSESFEHGRPTRILGLSKDFAPYRNMQRVKDFVAPGRASQSSTHGGFDNDETTRNTVIRLIQERP